jgi:hypothetical protein
VAHTEKTGGQYVAQPEKMGNEYKQFHKKITKEGKI